MLCYAMLCYAMLCYAMLCYAMLCYAMLCYAMLCCGLVSLYFCNFCLGWEKWNPGYGSLAFGCEYGGVSSRCFFGVWVVLHMCVCVCVCVCVFFGLGFAKGLG
jgi:hypothetical protein